MNFTNNTMELKDFGSREQRLKELNKKLPVDYLIYFLAGLFVTTDTICIFVLWDSVTNGDWKLAAILAFIAALALDLPALGAGLAANKLIRKEKIRYLIGGSVALVVFIIAALAYGKANYEARELQFKDPNVVSDDDVVSEPNPNLIVTFGKFKGVLPILTSGASFCLTLLCKESDEDRKKRIKKLKLKAENHELLLKSLIDTIEEQENYITSLFDTEDEKIKVFVDECKSQGKIREQAFLTALEEYCEDNLHRYQVINIANEKVRKDNLSNQEASEQ